MAFQKNWYTRAVMKLEAKVHSGEWDQKDYDEGLAQLNQEYEDHYVNKYDDPRTS